MAKLNIELVADAQKALGGFHDVEESASSLFKQLVKGEDVSDKFAKALGLDMAVAADKAGGGIKSLAAQMKVLSKYQEESRQRWGDTSEIYTSINDLVREAQTEIAKLEAKNRKATEAAKQHAQILEEASRAADFFGKQFTQNEKAALEYIEKTNAELERQRQNIASVNSKNANVGFMMLTGDKVGVANYALKEYEQTLKQVIADTGINSEETQKALAVYQEQAKYVEILKEETSGYGTALRNTAPAVDKFAVAVKQADEKTSNYGKKLVSVATNILKFQLLMGPITSAVRGFRNTISDSAKAAAEAEQVFSKLATVFDSVADSANRVAASVASTIGVSKSTAASALSTVGDLLQAQGMGTSESLTTASKWVSQFQDIIAFKDLNTSLEDFAQTFMSGAAGNLRNFRQFGSIVKESAVNARLAAKGLDQLTGSELALAKMTARAEIALEQQANAMGATEREWDNMLSVNKRMAEAQKELKENLGDWLNQSLKPIKTIWTEILDTINDSVASSKKLPQFAANMAFATPSILFSREADSDIWERNTRSLVGGFANYYGMMSEETDLDTVYDYDATLNETAAKIAKLFVSFGMTVEEGMKAFEDDWLVVQTLEDDYFGDIDIRAELQKRMNNFVQWVDDALGVEPNTNKIAEAVDRISNVYENLAAIAGVSVDSTLGSFNKYSGSLSGATGASTESAMMQLAGNLQLGIAEALESLGSADWQTFFSKSQLAFGEGTEAGGLNAKIESLKAVYNVIQNATDLDEKKREEYLNKVVEIYGEVLDRQKEINDEIERQSQFASALSSMSSAGSNYDVQLAQIGMTDQQKATDNLRRQYAEAYALAATADEQEQINDAYEEAERTLLAFYAAQERYDKQLEKEAKEKERLAKYNDAVSSLRESTADYRTQIRQLGMTSDQKALDDLMVSFEKLKATLDLTQEEEEDLNEEYEEQRKALLDLQAATREAARIQAWKALGNRALGSTGTMGGVIQSLTSEEGDTWTKILNAILTILENTEGWDRVAALLDQVFQAFEPVIDAIVDVIAALPWDIIIFCVKVIASIIVIIAKFVEQVLNVFDWLWGNIKTAVHNIIEAIKHPLNKNARDTWEFSSWEELQKKMAATDEKGNKILERIWGTTWEISEKMGNSNLDALGQLLDKEIISTDQFYRGAMSLQSDTDFSPMRASDASFISSAGPSRTTVTYGNMTFNFYGTDPDEQARAVLRVLEQNTDVPITNTPISLGAY